MSSGNSADPPADQPPLSIRAATRVEEIDGQKVVRVAVEPALEGHTFAVDLSASNDDPVPSGPFRLEYVLGSEFIIHIDQLPAVALEEGYSHLSAAPELTRARLTLTYSDRSAPESQKSLLLQIKAGGGIVRRIVAETRETDLLRAVRHTGQMVADLLDSLSFMLRVPISVRHIEVYPQGKTYLRRYMTLPYSSRLVTPDDVLKASALPRRLRSAFRLFREALSSNRPHYRLLCLYRIREVLSPVQRQNDQELLKRGVTPDRPRRLLPSNELTRHYFPDYVGKKVGAFLDHVRTEYRLQVAHGDLNGYFSLLLDPANVRTDHRVDFTNAALIPVMAELIQDESDLITRHGLPRE